MDLVKAVEQQFVSNKCDNVEVGDYVRAHLQIREGTRVRIQVFEGTVIARKGTGTTETFTIRRLSYGVGVERVIPVHSPRIDKIEIVRKGKVRRAKLYYLRDRVGKQARVKEKLGALKALEAGLVQEELVDEEVPVEETVSEKTDTIEETTTEAAEENKVAEENLESTEKQSTETEEAQD